MRVWVDADACPQDVKEVLFKAARKRQFALVLVANQPVRTPGSKWISSILVGAGANVADQRIVDECAAEDLVITADIPLAAQAVEKGATVISPRGQLYTAENMGDRLAARDLMDQLRGSGLVTGGPAGFGDKDRAAFSNQLDRWLTKAGR